MPLYKIVFTDKSIFLGGDTIKDSKWNEIPDKEILCLEYFLCDGSSLMLRNFEAYGLFTESLSSPLIKKIGNCPKCNKPGKLSKAILKHGDGSTSTKMIARCKDTVCKWMGDIKDLKDANNSKGKYFKFIMGLRKGKVLSHRISLGGMDGEDKYQSGDVTTRLYNKGEEYRKKPISDNVWKKGIK